MYKNFSRWVLALALVVICVALLPNHAQAADVNDLTYAELGGKITITGCDVAVSGELEIPQPSEKNR